MALMAQIAGSYTPGGGRRRFVMNRKRALRVFAIPGGTVYSVQLLACDEGWLGRRLGMLNPVSRDILECYVGFSGRARGRNPNRCRLEVWTRYGRC
jgi:hypothetical protein